jgi:cell wall-associated NlpC family hydrolase
MTAEIICREAEEWIGTPFFPHAYIKQQGCSCQTCATAIYSGAGVLPPDFRVPEGPLDWSRANRDSLIEPFVDTALAAYLEPVNRKGDPLPRNPEPGELLGFHVGGCLHHLGICVTDGQFVHCLRQYGVVKSSLEDATWLTRLVRIWRPLIW